jgi:CBS domain containing-hemolysin-like protein
MSISLFLASAPEAAGAPATSWDPPGVIVLKLLAIIFLVLLNGFFVASEFAIVKVRGSQLETLADRGDGRANWLLQRIFHLDPVRESASAHNEDELRLILHESARAARISPVSQEIAANAFEIRRRVVREVMTPRREVVHLDVGLSFRENLHRAKAALHTRFPLCEGHFDNAIGLVHIKDMLAQLDEPEPSLLAIKKELLVVPEMLPLEKLLARFRDWHGYFAVVVDEFGSNVGIVTLQHVIDEVIGQLPDEFGRERPEFRRVAEDEFLVDGALPIHEICNLAGLKWKDADVTTVGGYVVQRIGHIPHPGEQVMIDDYLVTVAKGDERRVHELRFTRIAKAPLQHPDDSASR